MGTMSSYFAPWVDPTDPSSRVGKGVPTLPPNNPYGVAVSNDPTLSGGMGTGGGIPLPPNVEGPVSAAPGAAESPFMPGSYTGPYGTGTYGPQTFATPEYAQQIAQQYGGTVSQGNMLGAPGSPFSLNNQQNMVTLPNGTVIDPAMIARITQNAGPGGLTAYDQAQIQDILNGSTGAALNQPGFNGINAPIAPNQAAAGQFGPGVQAALSNGTAPPGTNLGFGPGASAYLGSAAGAAPGSTGGASGGTGSTGGGAAPGAAPDTGSGGGTYGPSGSRALMADGGGGGLTRGILPGGYGVDQPGPMPNGAGAIGGTPTTFGYKNSNNVGDILSNDRQYAYGQGGELISNYGEGLAGFNQRARSLGAVGDSAYADLLQNPGYTAEQDAAIKNQSGLDALGWTPEMAQSNFLTPEEEAAQRGDPAAGQKTYNAQAENLRNDARNYGTSVSDVYDTGATDLNTATGGMSQRLDNAIDPTQLGLSSDFTQNYNFGPQQQQDIVNDAGRTVGQGTAAVTDQLQRQANAAGGASPLAMAAALDRQRQTGAVASADAMTKARIQAAQLGLTTEQAKEQMRLAAQEDLSSRRMQAATTAGQADIGNQQFLTSGRANAKTTTGQAYLDEQNRIAEQQTNLATATDATSAQRAQALAQNRQQVNRDNQTAQFTRGSYQDQAASQRATQSAGATRADQTSGRQDIRNEEQTGLNEANSFMAGQLQAFSGVTGAGSASQSNAIKSAQLPTTLDKVVGAATGAASGAGFKDGGIVDHPTIAHLGEDGPEIVIKLGGMRYKRRNEVPAYA